MKEWLKHAKGKCFFKMKSINNFSLAVFLLFVFIISFGISKTRFLTNGNESNYYIYPVSIPKKVGCSGRAREPIPLRSMKDSIIRSMNVFGLVASTLFLASSIARMTTNTFVVEPSDFEKSCKV